MRIKIRGSGINHFPGMLFCFLLVLFQNDICTVLCMETELTLFAVALVARTNKAIRGNQVGVFAVIVPRDRQIKLVFGLVFVPCGKNDFEVVRHNAQRIALFYNVVLLRESHKGNFGVSLCNRAKRVQIFDGKNIPIYLPPEQLEVVFPDKIARSIDKFIVPMLNHQQLGVVSVCVLDVGAQFPQLIHVASLAVTRSIFWASYAAQNGKVTNVCAQLLVASGKRKVVYSHN